MAKGDSGETGQLITNQNEARVQPAQDLNVQRTGTLYNNMNQNYGMGVNQNLPDYSGIMDSYRAFLGGGAPTGGSSYGMNPSQNRGMMGDYNPYPTSLPSINAGQQSNINQASRNNLGNNGLPIGQNGPGQATPAPPGTPRKSPFGGNSQGNAPQTQPQQSGMAGNFNPTGALGGQQQYNTGGMTGSSQDKFNQAAAALGLSPNQTRGHQVEIANYLNEHDQPGWKAGENADDWIGPPGEAGIDFSHSGDNAPTWRVDDPNAPENQAGYGGGGGSSPYYGTQTGAIPGWQDFALTGGFTPQGIQDIRARAIAPTRAIYENAQNDLKSQMARTGGYMPNYAAAQADLARKSNYGISDANISANAGIAQGIQQGRLGGLQGLTGAQLGAMQGMTGMFGASPGLAGTFGNQVLGANQQNLGNQSLQNQESDQLVNQKIKQSQIPSNYQQALGNIGGTVGVAGKIGMMAAGVSSAELKENIVPAEVDILDKLKNLKIYNWNYKADVDKTRHIGPIAEEFKEVFGVGNGKDIALIDVMGIMLATCKALAESR